MAEVSPSVSVATSDDDYYKYLFGCDYGNEVCFCFSGYPQNTHFGLGVMQFSDHAVEFAPRKSITGITGTFECVGVDYVVNNVTPSYYTVLFSQATGETLIMVDGTAVFFTNHWLLDLYAIYEGNTAEERTPVGSLLSNSNVLIVGSVASWSGKSFVQRTSYIDYVNDDLSCLPSPSKAYHFDDRCVLRVDTLRSVAD